MKRITVLSTLIFAVLLARAVVIAQETAGSDTQKSTKTKTMLNWQFIDQQMTAHKKALKEIIDNAEKSLKKMDEESKLRKSEKALTEVAKKAKAEAIQKVAQEAAAKAKAKREAEKKAAQEAAAKVKAKREAEKKAAQEAVAKVKAKREAEKKAAQEAAAKAKTAARQKAAEEAAAKAQEAVSQKTAGEAVMIWNRKPKQEVIKKAPIKVKAITDIKKELPAQVAKSSVVARRVVPPASISASAVQRHLVIAPAPEDQSLIPSEEVSAAYREAVALYWDNKYSEAKAKFEKVQKALPEYARTSYYLERVKKKLNE